MSAEPAPPSNPPPQVREKMGLELVTALLQRITARLRAYSMVTTLLALITLLLVMASLWLGAYGYRRWPASADLVVPLAMLGILPPLFGLQMVMMWERVVRDGTVLFEEISDEVEWRHRSYRPAHDEVARQTTAEANGVSRPDIDVRITLRNFLKEATLPLARTSSASTIYAAYFIASAIVILVVLLTGSAVASNL